MKKKTDFVKESDKDGVEKGNYNGDSDENENPKKRKKNVNFWENIVWKMKFVFPCFDL